MDYGPLLHACLRACVALALAGCGHMPVTSMVKLARVDFETSDPAQLRAAIKLPRALRPRPNGVSLRIAVRVGRAPEEARDFVLRELPAPSELAREAGADSHVFAYRIDEADLPRLTAFRTELIAKKSSGERGSISISVQPQACRASELPDGPVHLTSYLRTAETGAYVTLARDVDLRTLAPEHAIVDKIPRCAS
ncbi:hypothetical protein [Bradyrhizobium sp.]|uniref:hypothetical protein n=1 Tax=Bradyrhizobium sp. TaxID=376 RepID=UPI001D3C0F5D|nr:hypothetical protein [Bradyrhizobium sp.]MBI5319582.1 hypothetical protein [Bradyrhizobium sp.]